jgi:hypothetical protein
LNNAYREMGTKWTSSTWQTDVVNVIINQKGEEDGGEDGSEIHTAVRRSLTVHRNKQSLETISLNYVSCVYKALSILWSSVKSSHKIFFIISQNLICHKILCLYLLIIHVPSPCH